MLINDSFGHVELLFCDVLKNSGWDKSTTDTRANFVLNQTESLARDQAKFRCDKFLDQDQARYCTMTLLVTLNSTSFESRKILAKIEQDPAQSDFDVIQPFWLR
jgi:hypothetical protein